MTQETEPPTLQVRPIGGDTRSEPAGVATGSAVQNPEPGDASAATVVTPPSFLGGGAAAATDVGALVAAFQPQALPARLGRYTLLERLGVGGMAEVFLADQDGPAGFKKRVVVKRILPHLAQDPRFVDMFLREARVAARLNHTHVVQIYELGEENGVFFIAMEHVYGLSLFHLARRAWAHGRSVPLDVVLFAVADAAAGLDYANHALGEDGQPLQLVHRDISPDNLMINTEGMTKILDFGIAKDAINETVTKTGELKGKVPFMPPEQIDGQALDHRADLYSLGVTAYWLLTGRRPFDEQGDLRLLQAILAGKPRPVRQLNPAVPIAVEAWVHNLMARDPERRPKGGAVVARQVAALVSEPRADVGSFVREVMGLEDAPRAFSIEGLVPVTPTTGTIPTALDRIPEGLYSAEELTGPQRAAPGPTSGGATVEDDGPPVDIAFDDETALAPASLRSTTRGWAPWAGIASLVGAVALGLLLWPSAGDERRADDAQQVATPAAGVVKPSEDPTPALEETRAPPEEAAPPPEEVHARPEEVGDPEEAARDSDESEEDTAAEADVEGRAARKRGTLRSSRHKRTGGGGIIARAPGRIVWQSAGGKRVGKGSGTLDLSPSTKSVIAFDPAWGVKSSVPVRDGVVDYGWLAKGKLQVRAYPFADVYAGSKQLGTTPLPAVDVVEGAYELRLVHKDRELRRTVRVEAGQTTRVKVDMVD